MIQVLERRQGEQIGDYAFRVLRHNILTLRLEPGQVLRETELTEILQLSRTPLREAMIRLSLMYLVDIVPQSGTRVSLIDPELIEEALRLRLLVEPAIVECACDSVTEDSLLDVEDILRMQQRLFESNRLEELLLYDNAFHLALFKLASAERTYNAISSLFGHYDIVRALSLYYHTADIAVNDHQMMYAALKSKDKVQIRDIMIKHINRQSNEHIMIAQSFPKYFRYNPDRNKS